MAADPTMCTICHLQPHKYRCPTHPTILTCSLPCYKRHKSRASCTGQRNAAIYVKKSALVTPEGFDHDYNFLTKLERGIKDPKRMIEDMERPVRRRRMAPGGVEAYYDHNAITVERAPAGFQRAKQNETRMLKRSKKINWTVEWVDQDGKRRFGTIMQDETLETGWRKNNPQGDLKQVKHTAEDGPEMGKVAPDTSGSRPPVQASAPADLSEGSAQPTSQRVVALPIEENGTHIASCLEARLFETPRDNAQHPQLHPTSSTRHFYLHVPRSLTSKTVLVPLDPASTITDALTNKHVLEFPTIYVLGQAEEDLPAQYITESAYQEELTKEYKEVDVNHIVRSVKATVGHHSALKGGIFRNEDKQEAPVDKERILEMLRRDLRG